MPDVGDALCDVLTVGRCVTGGLSICIDGVKWEGAESVRRNMNYVRKFVVGDGKRRRDFK